MEQTAGIYWDRGGYDINQDSAAFEQVVLRRRIISMAVVADGIGGLSKGELASGYVTGRIVKWFYSEGAYLMLRALNIWFEDLLKDLYIRCISISKTMEEEMILCLELRAHLL